MSFFFIQASTSSLLPCLSIPSTFSVAIQIPLAFVHILGSWAEALAFLPFLFPLATKLFPAFLFPSLFFLLASLLLFFLLFFLSSVAFLLLNPFLVFLFLVPSFLWLPVLSLVSSEGVSPPEADPNDLGRLHSLPPSLLTSSLFLHSPAFSCISSPSFPLSSSLSCSSPFPFSIPSLLSTDSNLDISPTVFVCVLHRVFHFCNLFLFSLLRFINIFIICLLNLRVDVFGFLFRLRMYLFHCCSSSFASLLCFRTCTLVTPG